MNETVAEKNDDLVDNCQPNETNLEYKELLKKYEGAHLKALFEYCFKKNVPYISSVYLKIQKNDTPMEERMPEAYLEA